jgi:hypothetical protein
VGVLLALFLSGRSFGMTAYIGLLMLVGIVVKNAILLVDYTNVLREKGMERNAAVLQACARIIDAARRKGRKVGICGQAPSDFPDFAAFLVEQGIDSISLTPDSLLRTSERVLQAEQQPRPLWPARRATDIRLTAAGGARRPVAEPAAAWADTEPFMPGSD